MVLTFCSCSTPDTSKQKKTDKLDNQLETKRGTDSLSNKQNAHEPKLFKCYKNLEGQYFYKDNYNYEYHLSLICADNYLEARFIAPAPQEEHGMFYFVTEICKVDVQDSIQFKFTSDNRDLLSSQVTFNNYDSLMQSEITGGERYILNFLGTLTGDTLKIQCQSKNRYDCYFDVVKMVKNNR
jgi:hypothetical protein